MADAKVTVELDLKGQKLSDSAKNAAEVFAKRLEKGVSNLMKQMGLGDLVSGANTMKGAGGEASSGLSSAGIAGATAGIVVGLLGELVKAVSDFPMVAAVMKLFKLILMLLLLPLIPILKPVLVLLAAFAKAIVPIMKGLSDFIGKVLEVTLMPMIEAINLFFEFASNIGKTMWDLLNKAISKEFWIGLAKNLWEKVILPAWKFLKDVGKWIWEQVLLPAWTFLLEVGLWIWEQILLPAFSALADVGERIWNVIVTVWNWTLDFGAKVWEWLKTAWNWTLNIATTIWEHIKATWKWGLDIGQKLWNWISSHLKWGGFGGGSTKVSDAIITPSGVVHTDPNDYIIATKDPKSLGGGRGMTVNINIDKPTLTSQADIKSLVKQIEMELYKANRRYNSYV